jgi:hypothetical protein
MSEEKIRKRIEDLAARTTELMEVLPHDLPAQAIAVELRGVVAGLWQVCRTPPDGAAWRRLARRRVNECVYWLDVLESGRFVQSSRFDALREDGVGLKAALEPSARRPKLPCAPARRPGRPRLALAACA